MGTWPELGRETLLDAYMRKVEAVSYRLPNGEVGVFNIAVEGQVVGVIALTSDNKAILTMQFRPGPGRTLFELPGGYLDGGETPEQCARRELKEETGYEASELQFVGKTYADAYSTKIRHYFVATNCRRVADQQLDTREFIEVVSVTLPEFRNLLRKGQLSDVAGGYLALDALGRL